MKLSQTFIQTLVLGSWSCFNHIHDDRWNQSRHLDGYFASGLHVCRSRNAFD